MKYIHFLSISSIFFKVIFHFATNATNGKKGYGERFRDEFMKVALVLKVRKLHKNLRQNQNFSNKSTIQ